MTGSSNNVVRMKARVAARTALWLSAVVLGACNVLLGTEPADEAPDAPGPPGTTPDASGADEDGAKPEPAPKGRSDAGDVPFDDVVCGDMSGFLADAPWPTGGACNTRISRAAVPALVKPIITWRYDAGGDMGSGFMTGPAVGPDGTAYAIYATRSGAGYAYSLLAVRDGVLRFKTTFPDEPNRPNQPNAVPSLAADGTIYAMTPQGLSAFEASGALRWTYPLASGNGSSPAILPDGTVVVVGDDDSDFKNELIAIKPDGTRLWRLPSTGDGFVQSVAVTPSGLLVVPEVPPFESTTGQLAIVEPGGTRRANPTYFMLPLTTPLVLGDGTSYLVTTTSLEGITEAGALALRVPKSMTDPQLFGVHAPPFLWFGGYGGSNGLLRVDLGSGGATYVERGRTMLAAAGDGSLVAVTRGVGAIRASGMDPSGAERWSVTLESSGADMRPVALGADGAAVVALGTILYWIGDK